MLSKQAKRVQQHGSPKAGRTKAQPKGSEPKKTQRQGTATEPDPKQGPHGGGKKKHRVLEGAGRDPKQQDGAPDAETPQMPPAHPAANLFPMMLAPELGALATDIKENGQREAIVMYRGEILDGRNRYRACLKAGVKPTIVEWEGSGSPIVFVASSNIHRRHLNESQRAWVAARLMDLIQEEARKGLTKGAAATPESIPPEGHSRRKGRARDEASALFGISSRLVADANKVRLKGIPDLHAAVESGSIRISRAARIADGSLDEQRRALVRPEKRTARRSPSAPPSPQSVGGASSSPAPVGSLGDAVRALRGIIDFISTPAPQGSPDKEERSFVEHLADLLTAAGARISDPRIVKWLSGDTFSASETFGRAPEDMAPAESRDGAAPIPPPPPIPQACACAPPPPPPPTPPPPPVPTKPMELAQPPKWSRTWQPPPATGSQKVPEDE